ncbi:hypothetical protein [Alteromonas antoniana]|uniref:hypothetical protein n=1 Tax=Alteromonas antoniana TaxID=2803813 RepID=UPI001C45E3D3|nr:hypothetical protein [Alteromonas antoniana]
MSEPNNKFGEERRQTTPEQQEKYLERKNAFRIDYRQRIDIFSKSVLLFSAGGLTISMSMFLKKDGPFISDTVLHDLKLAWGLLLYTIISFCCCHYVMILQGQYVNKNWDGKLPLGDDQISGNRTMTVFRAFIGIIGSSGFITFILGLISLVLAALETIDKVSG